MKLKALTEFAAECAMAKVFGSETYHALADELLQVFGGNGFSEDYPAAQMYRDSRITRIYEGTSEICRLSIAKTMLKKVARGELESGSTARQEATIADSQSDETSGTRHIDAFRDLYGDLLAQLVDRFGLEGLRENDKQQYLSSLADIAIELYAAESTVLRVLKLTATRPGADLTLADGLARLTVTRSAGRIRTEAIEILSGIHVGDALADQLVGLERRMPLSENLVALRSSVAREIIERRGLLPNFRA